MAHRFLVGCVAGLIAGLLLIANSWGQAAPKPEWTLLEQMNLVADWRGMPERHWAGSSLWLNRLQDWVVRGGGLETTTPTPAHALRTAHVLSYALEDVGDSFVLQTVVSVCSGEASQEAFAGFLVGAGEGRLDYRAAALIHDQGGKGGGILCTVQTDGAIALVFKDMGSPNEIGYPSLPEQENSQMHEGPFHGALVLRLEGYATSSSHFTLRLTAWNRETQVLLAARIVDRVPARRLRGNVALVSHPGLGPTATRHRFEQLLVGGERLVHHPERAFGPIAGTLFSLSGNKLKMSAQFVHLGDALAGSGGRARRFRPVQTAALEIRPLGGESSEWETLCPPQAITTPDYYTVFEVGNWDSTRDWETRVAYNDSRDRTHHYRTVVPRDPVEKDVVSLAAFTGMGIMARPAYGSPPKPTEGEELLGRWTPANVWFPFGETVAAVNRQDVDILFFTGDQIYQNKPSPVKADDRFPAADYLYKWLLWHWAFRDLTNHLPAIVQADDHDVYQGNFWGWSGRTNTTGLDRDGGYIACPSFINLVYRTMAGHNPEAYAAGAPSNGITSYFCGFTYGGIGFAVLEDRAFKTPPSVKEASDQELLGAAQERFLDEWGKNWSGQKMKVAVSQSVYASMHVNFDGELINDTDSGGWPKGGRDRAVRLLQRARAFIVSGDQHLATFSRLGLDAPSDGPYQFCVPAVGNIFWRWFYPAAPGKDRAPGEAGHLGEFTDRFGNFFRMLAVANPEKRELLGEGFRYRPKLPRAQAQPKPLDRKRAAKGDGYGVVRVNKREQTVTAECWPYDADPTNGGTQYRGWPQTIKWAQLDGRTPVAWLPDVVIEGQPDPVVQVVDQATGEVVSTTRAYEGFCRPGVYSEDGIFTLRVGEPGAEAGWRVFRDLAPTAEPGLRTLSVAPAG
ncbi:MAG: hypothetical protein GWP08_05530 [Nitrospiraceae bacterium]|nr:hypothetical protein [Nitrospiraceae bacterium]